MASTATTTNILRRIEDLGQAVAKDYSNLRLMPRGTPVFFDQNLRGTIRFAARRGNFLPVIAPQNDSELAADVAPPTDRLTLARVTAGFTVTDAVISLGPGRELARIADIDETTGEVTTAADMVGTHVEGEGVDLYGVPIEVIGPQAAGDTAIQVRSSHLIVIGDQVAIDTTQGLLSSTVSTDITGVLYLGTALDGRRNYELTLSEGIARPLANEEDILLRAQPGYESRAGRIDVRGPFVLDYVSGPFFERTTVDEFLNVQLQNSLGDPLPGFSSPVSLGKNSAVVNMSIPNEALLFWQVLAGASQFRDNRFTAVTDADGHFTITQELVPPFPAGVEWEIPVRADDAALIRVAFLPNDYRTFSVGAGTPTRITVGMLSSEQPSTRIEIVVQSQNAGAEIIFNDWVTTTSSAAQLYYQVTSTAFGSNEWQAGSLLLKPYFFTLADIRARYDFTAYNQGVVHF
jgi:hypothetical protein